MFHKMVLWVPFTFELEKTTALRCTEQKHCSGVMQKDGAVV